MAETSQIALDGWGAVVVLVALFVCVAAVRITYHRNYWREYFASSDETPKEGD